MAGAVFFDLDGTLTPRRASIEHFAPIFASDLAEALGPVDEAILRRIPGIVEIPGISTL